MRVAPPALPRRAAGGLLTLFLSACGGPPPPAPTPEEPEPPVRWSAPWPDLAQPAAGFPVLEGAEHASVFVARPETGVYSHHAHIAHRDGVFYALWSLHAFGEDGPGQKVVLATSRDGIAWSPPGVVFPARGPVAPAEEKGRVVTANGFAVVDGVLYAIADVHDNIGYTDEEGREVVEVREPPFRFRARRGLGRIARSVGAEAGPGPIFWLIPDPPEPLEGFPALPASTDPEVRALAAAIDAELAEPLQYPQWNFHLAARRGYWTDVYPEVAVDGHYMVEPTTYRRPDGVFVRLFRDRNPSHRLYASTSPDGESWSAPGPTGIPDSPSRSCAGTLPDGTVYLLGNLLAGPLGEPETGGYGRDTLVLALSDDGCVFHRAWALRAGAPEVRYPGMNKGPGFQYPDAVVAGDALWVIYTVGKEDVAVSRVPLASLARR